jgi:hypothetical protein
MDQNHATIFFFALLPFIENAAQQESPSFSRPDHSRDFGKEARSSEMALKIGGPSL